MFSPRSDPNELGPESWGRSFLLGTGSGVWTDPHQSIGFGSGPTSGCELTERLGRREAVNLQEALASATEKEVPLWQVDGMTQARETQCSAFLWFGTD